MFWYRDYSAQYRCGACHVRTGTLAFGIVQLFAMAFAVAFFGVCFLQPEAIPKPVQMTFLRTFDLITMGYSNANPSGRMNAVRSAAADSSTKANDVPMDVIVYADGSHAKSQSPDDSRGVLTPGVAVDKTDVDDSETTTTANAHTDGGNAMSGDWFASPNRVESRRSLSISKWSEEDRVAVLVLLALGLLVTGLLCTGILRRRPSWMMPYFCLQVFDLCITCISMLAYFSNVPNPKDFAMEPHGRPRLEDTLNGQLFLVLMGALVMFGKMYWISIVWACYKYLIEQLRLDLASGRGTRRNERAQNSRLSAEDGDSDLIVAMSLSLGESGLSSAPAQAGPSPPKYTDVVSKIPANAHAPPPYFAIAASDAAASTSYAVPPPPIDAGAPPSARSDE